MESVPLMYIEAVEMWLEVNNETHKDIVHFWIDHVHRWELTTHAWCYTPLLQDGQCWVRAIYRLN